MFSTLPLSESKEFFNRGGHSFLLKTAWLETLPNTHQMLKQTFLITSTKSLEICFVMRNVVKQQSSPICLCNRLLTFHFDLSLYCSSGYFSKNLEFVAKSGKYKWTNAGLLMQCWSQWTSAYSYPPRIFRKHI